MRSVTLGESIRRLRLINNISQKQLVAATGIAKSYISMIENGERTPGLQIIERIAAMLGVTVAELYFLASGNANKTGTPYTASQVARLNRMKVRMEQVELIRNTAEKPKRKHRGEK